MNGDFKFGRRGGTKNPTLEPNAMPPVGSLNGILIYFLNLERLDSLSPVGGVFENF